MHDYSHLKAFAFLAEAAAITDAAELERRFAGVLAEFGLDRYFCATLDPRGRAPVALASEGVIAWDRHMTERGYDEANPCRRWGASGRESFTWREVQAWSRRVGDPHPKERELWGEAASNGMRDGLTVAMPGSGGEVLFARMMTAAPSIRAADRPVLESVAIVFATLRLRLQQQDRERPLGALLTPREAECLRWASRGMTDRTIAGRLGLSPKTVNFHVENARRKLAAPTRLAAYQRALELGALA
jgi:LuxR family transcriptional activator of conjugal transfer of Ti plasmids